MTWKNFDSITWNCLSKQPARSGAAALRRWVTELKQFLIQIFSSQRLFQELHFFPKYLTHQAARTASSTWQAAGWNITSSARRRTSNNTLITMHIVGVFVLCTYSVWVSVLPQVSDKNTPDRNANDLIPADPAHCLSSQLYSNCLSPNDLLLYCM